MAKKREPDLYVVGAGQISGTFADWFHHVYSDGTVGLGRRPPTDEERTRILADIRRHRARLVHELSQLERAEDTLRARANGKGRP